MLASDYLEHCKNYYPDDYNSETAGTRTAISYLTDYLSIPASEFTPLKLKAVREKMITTPRDRGKRHSRAYANRLVRQILRMFRWGVETELVTASAHQAL